MKKLILYSLVVLAVFSSCEEIYTPKLESMEDVMVVDGRIISGKNDNQIRLYKSLGFNENSNAYLPITSAKVWLMDDQDNEIELPNQGNGAYPVNFNLDAQRSYRLKIEYNGDVYESEFESVPVVPPLDTIYGVPETKVYQYGAEDDLDMVNEVEGLQLYTDIRNTNVPYYRFSAKKVMQYTFSVEIVVFGELLEESVFAWNSYYPDKDFNIAGPARFSNSNDIIKHPLYFMSDWGPIPKGNYFAGWILMLYQYGISENAHDYYKDLNSQLNSEGKLFDPLYTQARNNLKCTSDSKQIVLGNFEISSYIERRYFVQYVSEEVGYVIKPIPYFYNIPFSGEQLTTAPEWWETYYRTNYPND